MEKDETRSITEELEQAIEGSSSDLAEEETSQEGELSSDEQIEETKKVEGGEGEGESESEDEGGEEETEQENEEPDEKEQRLLKLFEDDPEEARKYLEFLESEKKRSAETGTEETEKESPEEEPDEDPDEEAMIESNMDFENRRRQAERLAEQHGGRFSHLYEEQVAIDKEISELENLIQTTQQKIAAGEFSADDPRFMRALRRVGELTSQRNNMNAHVDEARKAWEGADAARKILDWVNWQAEINPKLKPYRWDLAEMAWRREISESTSAKNIISKLDKRLKAAGRKGLARAKKTKKTRDERAAILDRYKKLKVGVGERKTGGSAKSSAGKQKKFEPKDPIAKAALDMIAES